MEPTPVRGDHRRELREDRRCERESTKQMSIVIVLPGADGRVGKAAAIDAAGGVHRR